MNTTTGEFNDRCIQRQVNSTTGEFNDRWIQRQVNSTTGEFNDRWIQRQVNSTTGEFNGRWIQRQANSTTGEFNDRWIQQQVNSTTGEFNDRWIQRQVNSMTGGFNDRWIQRQVNSTTGEFNDRWIETFLVAELSYSGMLARGSLSSDILGVNKYVYISSFFTIRKFYYFTKSKLFEQNFTEIIFTNMDGRKKKKADIFDDMSKHAHLFIALTNNWNHTCSPLLSPSSQYFPLRLWFEDFHFYNLSLLWFCARI